MVAAQVAVDLIEKHEGVSAHAKKGNHEHGKDSQGNFFAARTFFRTLVGVVLRVVAGIRLQDFLFFTRVHFRIARITTHGIVGMGGKLAAKIIGLLLSAFSSKRHASSLMPLSGESLFIFEMSALLLIQPSFTFYQRLLVMNKTQRHSHIFALFRPKEQCEDGAIPSRKGNYYTIERKVRINAEEGGARQTHKSRRATKGRPYERPFKWFFYSCNSFIGGPNAT